jgi:chemotaxis protein MotB
MPGFHRRRQHNGLDAWPGYVDALSTLLMVTIFVLLVFVLAQGLLSVTLTGKDKALERLNQEISQLTDMLSLERGRAADLQGNVASLAHDLGEVTTARDALAQQLSVAQTEVAQDSTQVSALTAERDRLNARLADTAVQAQSASARLNDIQGQLSQQTAAAAQANSQFGTAQATLATTETALTATRQKLSSTDADLSEATAAIAAATAVTRLANERVADLQSRLTAAEARADTAEASLATARTSLQQDVQQLAQEQQLVSAGGEALTQQKQATGSANEQIAMLNQQMEALRQQLAAISSALQLQESNGRDKDAQIADLGRKLNLALAAKVQELQRYRSDFFGKLREILKNQPNIKIVGDRFVFQSDVLFPVDEATLTGPGQGQIGAIATAVQGFMKEIPPNIAWILRVDGHADSQPITSGPYKNNWELSSARAIAVVQLLIQDGVPPDHLAATAFADTQPIDPAQTQAAYAKNRRIEFRLTDR